MVTRLANANESVTMGAMAIQPTERPIPQDTLALRLYIARNKSGRVISQREAAKALAVSHATWANWEKGRYEPRATQIRQIAMALEVDVDWLFNGGPLLPAPPPAPLNYRLVASTPRPRLILVPAAA